MSLIIILAIFLILIRAENVAARRYGNFPVIAAMLAVFALLVGASDIDAGNYWGAGGCLILAVAATAAVRDLRDRS